MTSDKNGIGISEIEETAKPYSGETWLCPICAMKRFPYGKMHCKGPAECGNEAHITGQTYLDEQGYVKRRK